MKDSQERHLYVGAQGSLPGCVLPSPASRSSGVQISRVKEQGLDSSQVFFSSPLHFLSSSPSLVAIFSYSEVLNDIRDTY